MSAIEEIKEQFTNGVEQLTHGNVRWQNIFAVKSRMKSESAKIGSAMSATKQNGSINVATWLCTCGTANKEKFCSNCGHSKPDVFTTDTQKWVCRCGTENEDMFCANCGQPKPVAGVKDSDSWVCSCGMKNTEKFCAECGKEKPTKYRFDNVRTCD